MSVNKVVTSVEEAVAGIGDGATLMVSGFGPPGQPSELIDAVLATGVSDLTIINNNAGAGGRAISDLFAAKRVRKVICSFPKAIGSTVFDDLYRAGEIQLELVPQGTLAERIRAGGAGIKGFFTPTAYGTELAAGKETRVIDGIPCVLETPLYADFALVRADTGDRYGNLTYRKTGRNFGPLMAAAADVAIAEVAHLVEPSAMDAEAIVTPGIYIDRLLVLDEAAATEQEAR
ncbi:3-oxoacid CoA-transferase subunit A [Rhodococcus rhodochrous]|uniref:3-oxoacid CoA-transferase subunit A n=1 Tax=Rhodococcus rhodochrous TaxID=1829 RepID=UPI001E5CFB86|nr:3-oxoacid CoA-transferase subunit A [Rhodococcus rhodochrous]MCD2100336.1 3-oxoacid CoA-transferase subunit A [Rhodococcus rhodochrous]MCD2124669.1 3-oxoacid CoA-transferase subunit A [Rhodococcus rhodochrous]MCQ4137994.1 3-oxoacid CoA-transferase subunit A [Rhodococcus rhodochrous]MDJ0021548.1 3-oxoacid CoA-transferase subunit A [Rhodococcus rhodochrous]